MVLSLQYIDILSLNYNKKYSGLVHFNKGTGGMKIIIVCQAVFFCVALIFTYYNVRDRFFKNKVGPRVINCIS